MELRAKYTFFAEGARGSLTKTLVDRFALRAGVSPQKYGIGLKELWQVDAGVHKPGLVMHSVRWPLDAHTRGGSFMEHPAQGPPAPVGFRGPLHLHNPSPAPF